MIGKVQFLTLSSDKDELETIFRDRYIALVTSTRMMRSMTILGQILKMIWPKGRWRTLADLMIMRYYHHIDRIYNMTSDLIWEYHSRPYLQKCDYSPSFPFSPSSSKWDHYMFLNLGHRYNKSHCHNFWKGMPITWKEYQVNGLNLFQLTSLGTFLMVSSLDLARWTDPRCRHDRSRIRYVKYNGLPRRHFLTQSEKPA